jgi:hypothetical protein
VKVFEAAFKEILTMLYQNLWTKFRVEEAQLMTLEEDNGNTVMSLFHPTRASLDLSETSLFRSPKNSTKSTSKSSPKSPSVSKYSRRQPSPSSKQNSMVSSNLVNLESVELIKISSRTSNLITKEGSTVLNSIREKSELGLGESKKTAEEKSELGESKKTDDEASLVSL